MPARVPSGVPARVPARVGVLGGGRMGAGIAHAFLVSGAAEVVVVERDEASVAAARERIDTDLRRTRERAAAAVAPPTQGIPAETGGDGIRLAANPMAREPNALGEPHTPGEPNAPGEPHTPGETHAPAPTLTVTIDLAAFAGCGLVVEAVPEDFALKTEALARMARHAGPDAWLATNTSSLSVTALAAGLERPERLCGLHFFNPVPASKLVEVVVAEQTADELVARAREWVAALGKTAVVVKDAPGFASSRLGVAIGLEAIRMVEEGVASPEDIDAAMVLGYRFPIGPLALTDIVGLDVRLGIAEYLAAELGPRFEPPQLMRDMVARGDLGRKSGRGFYTYG
ncbi:3-hydroxyacyl-CoA dehydrogenase family protein [Microbacterium aureliae]